MVACLVGGAHLFGLHTGFGLGAALERVAENGELGHGRRPLINDRALLRFHVLYDIVFRSGLRRGRDDGRPADRNEYGRSDDDVFHIVLS
jgi:hypothetical protein